MPAGRVGAGQREPTTIEHVVWRRVSELLVKREGDRATFLRFEWKSALNVNVRTTRTFDVTV